MNLIYLKNIPWYNLRLNENAYFKGKYICEKKNSCKLQTIFWDGAGLNEELLDVHNTGAVTSLMGKHNIKSC